MVGVPATVLHATNDNRSETVVVAECVQIFITAMDALKLGQRAVDDIQPLLTDLMNSLTRVGSLSPEFAGIVKIGTWIKKLHGMRAVEELSEDDVRQLLFDLDSSYGDFHKHLAGYK